MVLPPRSKSPAGRLSRLALAVSLVLLSKEYPGWAQETGSSTATPMTAVSTRSPLPAAPAGVEATSSPLNAELDEVDRLWKKRAEGSQGGRAANGPIDEVIATCRKAIQHDPSSLEARWRLMRALYFKGEYATADSAAKRIVFDSGRAAGEEALERIRSGVRADASGSTSGSSSARSLLTATPVELVPFVKGREAVTACFLWSGVDWGKWALVFGKSAAVKQGAAAKIRDLATAVIALDPAFEEGGGYRVLGRLHHQTPSVPFFTGWASRTEALKYLRLAFKTAPRNFINRQYLAEAMWDYEKTKRTEARAMLQALVQEKPSEEFPVEDRKSQEEARALLAAWQSP